MITVTDQRVFDTEKRALCGDKSAIVRIVGALRRHRAAAQKLLDSRYADGEVDAAQLSRFESECAEIEEET